MLFAEFLGYVDGNLQVMAQFAWKNLHFNYVIFLLKVSNDISTVLSTEPTIGELRFPLSPLCELKRLPTLAKKRNERKKLIVRVLSLTRN